MTAWASMLVPAGSVVVGAAIAGGTAIGGQFLTHRSSSKREREARYDAFRVTRFEIERETLLRLQEALIEHVDLVVNALEVAATKEAPEPTIARNAVVRSYLKIATLTSRCLAQDAVGAVHEFLSKCQDSVESSNLEASRAPELMRAQELLGAALRKDPFENNR